MDKPVLCIYHGNCADGFGAAWAMHHYFGSQVEFHAGKYGTPPPDVAGRDVYVVDFSYPRDVLIEMAKHANSLRVLDHHKTARDDLRAMPADANITVIFDMERSGARIAWDYLFPGQSPPLLLQHIEDRDLWRFALNGTREIMGGLFSHPYDFDLWDKLMAPDAINELVQLRLDGEAIERKQARDIEALLKATLRTLVIGGKAVPAANIPYMMASDAGQIMLADGAPFAACYWDTDESRTFSLRSLDTGADVSAIASLYGGGGHRNAAGFRVGRDHELARA